MTVMCPPIRWDKVRRADMLLLDMPVSVLLQDPLEDRN